MALVKLLRLFVFRGRQPAMAEEVNAELNQLVSKTNELIDEVALKTSTTIGITQTQAFRGDHGLVAHQHSLSLHAPTNAQRNSDITKAEIENRLTGVITTHMHSGLLPENHAVQHISTGLDVIPIAVHGGASGLMSGADKAKLDAVNMTPAGVGLCNVDNVKQMPLSFLDTSTTMGANSDVRVPSQRATKTYVDTVVAALGTGLLESESAPRLSAPLQARENTISFGVRDYGNSGTAQTINWNSGNFQKITVTANTTLTFTPPANGGGVFTLKVSYGGAFTITWGTTIRWAGGVIPTPTSQTGRYDIFAFVFDGQWAGLIPSFNHTV